MYASTYYVNMNYKPFSIKIQIYACFHISTIYSKIKFKIKFQIQNFIYTSHVSRKNQILKLFSKYVCQFSVYEIRGSDTTIEI